MATKIRLGYEARPQFLPFHQRKERWAVLVVHRRGGKTVACIMDLLDAALTSQKDRPRFAYIAPQLKQAKTVAWDYLKHYGLRVPGATAHESELRLDLPNGGQVRLHGSDNPDALRGIYLDGLVMDEAADVSPRLFNEILRPALSDRQGWCVWIGTPKGQNDFYDLWQTAKHEPDRYFTLMLRASQTGLVDRDELEDARRMMTPEQYAQEYECSFSAAIVGAYYGREMQAAEDEGRIVKGLYDPGMEVHTSWDLGVSDHTVIWFYQQSGFEVRWIDFYAANGFGFDHYADVLQKKRYRYGRHNFPHDVMQRHQAGGYIAKSRKETLEGLGIPVTVGAQVKDVSERINVVRRILPRSWFDADKCEEGIKALRQYRRKWDDVRKVFVERPEHDWCSHPADSFGEGCMGIQEPRTANVNMPRRQMSWVV